jgi:hypothetical protein
LPAATAAHHWPVSLFDQAGYCCDRAKVPMLRADPAQRDMHDRQIASSKRPVLLRSHVSIDSDQRAARATIPDGILRPLAGQAVLGPVAPSPPARRCGMGWSEGLSVPHSASPRHTRESGYPVIRAAAVKTMPCLSGYTQSTGSPLSRGRRPGDGALMLAPRGSGWGSSARLARNGGLETEREHL